MLTCEIGANHDVLRNSLLDTTQDNFLMQYQNNILIHVHGLQHTGTGFLRSTIHKILGGNANVSVQHSPGVIEDEGQHMQSVYPRGYNRLYAWKRANTHNISQFMYLPDLCNLPEPNQTGHILMQNWSNYWDTSKQYLIQKTPFLDVGFLERVKIMPTFHAIILRHPMTYNEFQTWKEVRDNPDFLLGWLDVWTHVLDLLANDQVESYAIVTYESLVDYTGDIGKEMMDIIQHDNSHTFDPILGRRLHFHSAKNTSKYLRPTRKMVDRWKQCLTREPCHDLLEDLNNDVFPYMGYYLDSLDPRSVSVGDDFGSVLFSSNKRPPDELVTKMRKLLAKYS